MKTTMEELFTEMSKDNINVSLSMPEMDLNQVAKAMDEKLNKLMEKMKTKEAPEEAQNGAETPEKPTEGNTPEEPESPQNGAEEARGGGEEADK